LAKASFVGAKTVNGPAPDRVSARPAAFTAATRVEKSGLAAAMSTMVWAFAADVGDSAAIVVEDVESALLDEHAPRMRQAAATTVTTARRWVPIDFMVDFLS
jgi:hypothetical protein